VQVPSTTARLGRPDRAQVSKLTIGEAAALLHTAPSTIRSWEQRLGYPTPTRSASGRRLYDEAEIALLADALRQGLSISSAIRQIHAQIGSHQTLLQQALIDLDFTAADALLEAAIALRGVSRAFDDTVLAALDQLSAAGHDPSVIALALEWTQDRGCWSRRQVSTPTRHIVVVVDGTAEDTITRAASCILQLQLVLRSVRALVLHAQAIATYRALARRVDARAIVFIGEPPAHALGGGVLSTHVAGFRTNVERLHPHAATLPSLPRLAADRLLALADSNGVPTRL
jgi:DNA-binding transcriptional MerR regulator